MYKGGPKRSACRNVSPDEPHARFHAQFVPESAHLWLGRRISAPLTSAPREAEAAISRRERAALTGGAERRPLEPGHGVRARAGALGGSRRRLQLCDEDMDRVSERYIRLHSQYAGERVPRVPTGVPSPWMNAALERSISRSGKEAKFEVPRPYCISGLGCSLQKEAVGGLLIRDAPSGRTRGLSIFLEICGALKPLNCAG